MNFQFTSVTAAAFGLFFTSCEVTERRGEEVLDLFPSGFQGTGEVYEGKMSWYSVATNGGTRTASGEKLSDGAHTAAHRTLPFGTRVRVTNLANDRSTVVRITDRGPFIAGRIIDVSLAAGKDLDFIGRGIAPCRIEVLH